MDFLSDADPAQPFHELSAWIFCPTLTGRSHLMSSQPGFFCAGVTRHSAQYGEVTWCQGALSQLSHRAHSVRGRLRSCRHWSSTNFHNKSSCACTWTVKEHDISKERWPLSQPKFCGRTRHHEGRMANGARDNPLD